MAAFDPAPATLDQVVDPVWLTGMLRAHHPGAEVRAVSVVETLITQATKVRLSLEIAGDGGTLPRQICIKGVLTNTGAPRSASVVETLFYRELAQQAPVRVPPCIHAGLAEDGGSGVIVMRDVIVDGARFCSALTPFTPDEARQTLSQLAQLHAQAWQSSRFFETGSIPHFLDQIASRPLIPPAMLQEMLDGERGEPLPRDIRDAARLQAGVYSLSQQVHAEPGCLVHGDAHAGNIYRDADGFGIVDWQILQKGEWAQDVAYHLAAVLSPEDRRTHERALLDEYRAMLVSFGGPHIPADHAWTRYRAGMVYGYYLWAITRKVDPVLTHEFVRRLGLAVSELDGFAAAGE